MLESLFARSVAGTLERFFETICPEQVDRVQLLSGRVVFKNLVLRRDFFAQILRENVLVGVGSPDLAALLSLLQVAYGNIGRVVICVPWREGNGSPEQRTSVLEIHDMHLLLKLQPAAETAQLRECCETWTRQAIEQAVERELQTLLQQQQQADTPAQAAGVTTLSGLAGAWKTKVLSWQWWLGMDEFVNKALQRVRVQVTGTHVRFEGQTTEEEEGGGGGGSGGGGGGGFGEEDSQFACGFCLRSVELSSSFGPRNALVVDTCRAIVNLITGAEEASNDRAAQVQLDVELDGVGVYFKDPAPSSFQHISPASKSDAFSRLVDVSHKTQDHLLFVPASRTELVLEKKKNEHPEVTVHIALSDEVSCKLHTTVFRRLAFLRSHIRKTSKLLRYISQDTTRHDTTRHDTARQGKARQAKTRQDKTRHDTTSQDKARQGKPRYDATRRDTIRCAKTRQDMRRQDKTATRQPHDNHKTRQAIYVSLHHRSAFGM
jgi:hypothetical protein